jgi:hypothetical protein
VRICPAMSQVQARGVRRSATAMRDGHVRGASARRCAAWLTGELAAARTSVFGRRCMRCNESCWCPGETRGGTSDAAVRPVPRSCGGGRPPWLSPAMMHPLQPAAPGCIAMSAGAMMMRPMQRNQLHHRCIRSRRAMKSQVTAAAPWARQAEGIAGPRAAPQAAHVDTNCRMLHLMQLRALGCGRRRCGGYAEFRITGIRRTAGLCALSWHFRC